MSLLPTAHAGQAFGSRRIDFFTVSGQVSQSEAHTGHVVDHDGMEHDVRMMDETSALAPGDTATVLRVQSGPNRRSRPVAVVNHSRGVWMRAAPDATALLSRTGVTRTLNWWISVLLLVLVAAASVWPVLHAFLTELSGAMMASVPVFDIYADIAARATALGSWRLETALPAGIFDALAGLGFVPMDQLTEWGVALAATVLAITAFAARSWRLIYVPLLAILAILAGAILGGADATLLVVAGSLVVFMLGGLANRIRDGGRFNARVERLSEHVLRNPPQEGVKSGDSPEQSGTLAAAAAAAAIASAASVADGEEAQTPENEAAASDAEADEAEAAAPNDAAVNGEADAAENAIDLPPPPAAEEATPGEGSDAAATTAADAEPVEDNIAAAASDATPESTDAIEDDPNAADAEPEDATATETAPLISATETTTAADAESESEPAAVLAEIEPESSSQTIDDPGSEVADAAEPDDDASPATAQESPAADLTEANTAGDAQPAADAADADEIAQTAETSPEQPSEPAANSAESADTEPATEAESVNDDSAATSNDAEDDLPSLDAVAAANALDTDEDVQKAESEAPEALTLDDDRTMPVASPPPMAAPSVPAAAEAGESGEVGAAVSAERSDGADDTPTEVATPEGAIKNAPVDDPVIDDAGDPMLSNSAAGDPAPGAPEIELDTTSTE